MEGATATATVASESTAATATAMVAAESTAAAATAMVAAESTAAAATETPAAKVALYVGDLEGSVDEEQLLKVFSSVVPVVSVKLCRDLLTNQSLHYAYVNFSDYNHAAKAREVLNCTPINGKSVRVMHCHRDSSVRSRGFANVYIKNLDRSISNKALLDTFDKFGTVLSCKVAVDHAGQSKGFGFVQFEDEKDAKTAITQLNGVCLNDKIVYVGPFVRKQERLGENGAPKFTNVYVKNLPEAVGDEEDLKRLFVPFGTITSAVVARDGADKPRGFGFVNFQTPDEAVAAVEKLNGVAEDDRVLFVGRAQKKADREADLKAKFEQEKKTRNENLQGTNLYLKNIDESFNDEKLEKLFSKFGTITSCKVMTDSNGRSKGSGFVAFSTPEEATKALNELKGKMVGKKPLYIAVAQRKDQRKAWLQEQFAKHRLPPVAMGPLLPSSGIHAVTPKYNPHQTYFGQCSPSIVLPPQPTAGFGYPHQLFPQIQPSMPPTNFMLSPYHLQRQGLYNPRAGLRRGGSYSQQPLPSIHRNANQGTRLMNPSMARPMAPLHVPQPENQRPQHKSIATALSSTLSLAAADNRKQILGHQLFPLVEQNEPSNTGKVTGMLLEMGET